MTMRKTWLLCGLLTAMVTMSSCTPEQVAWWTRQIEDARTSGHHCPELSPARQLAGLPDAFDYIIWRESRCNPRVVNHSSGSMGLTQIMPMWLDDLCRAQIACTQSDMLDAHTNLAAAAYVLDVQGMSAWG